MVKLSTRTRVIFMPPFGSTPDRDRGVSQRPSSHTTVRTDHVHGGSVDLAELLGKRDDDALRPADVG